MIRSRMALLSAIGLTLVHGLAFAATPGGEGAGTPIQIPALANLVATFWWVLTLAIPGVGLYLIVSSAWEWYHNERSGMSALIRGLGSAAITSLAVAMITSGFGTEAGAQGATLSEFMPAAHVTLNAFEFVMVAAGSVVVSHAKGLVARLIARATVA